MKKQLNEIRRMQQLAGIITESQVSEVLDNDNFRFDFLQNFLNKKFNNKHIIGYEDKGPRQIDIILGKEEVPFDFTQGSSQKLGVDDIKMKQAGVITYIKDSDGSYSDNLSDSDRGANAELLDSLYTWVNKEKNH